MKTFSEHYKESQNIYKKNEATAAKVNLYNFTVREYNPPKSDDIIEIDDKMMSLINNISEVVKERFVDPKTHCWIPPHVDQKNDILFRMKNVWDINAVEELASLITPQIENNLFGSYSIVDGLYIYRSIFKENASPRGSMLWHFDNHIKERTKLLFYLNDVTEQNGPFEYMWNDEKKSALKAKTTKVDHTRWESYHSRVTEEEAAKFPIYGFFPKKMLGKMGTFAIFDNNIVHRACTPELGTYRDAFVLQLRPYHEKLRPHIDERWTGTNRHVDISTDPENRKVHLK